MCLYVHARTSTLAGYLIEHPKDWVYGLNMERYMEKRRGKQLMWVRTFLSASGGRRNEYRYTHPTHTRAHRHRYGYSYICV